MVSTRSSLAPDEKMEALDMSPAPRRATRSPSPKKRRLEEGTPEQDFVDARATPFTQRKRSLSSGSMDSPVPSTSNHAASLLQHEASDSENSDDDEAPEAVTNATTAKLARDLESVRQTELKKREEEAREKRRKKDETLRAQKQASKAASRTSHDEALAEIVENVAAEEEAEEENDVDADEGVKSKKLVIPRFLPDEILNQRQDSQLVSTTDARPVKTSTHIKFEPKKEVTTLRKGPLVVQLLKKQRVDMAPKQSASVANTKKQWLYQRGQNSANRRPIRKPLA